MADITVVAAVDTFMASADQTAMRTNLGLTALATTTPGTGVAAFLATPTFANLNTALTGDDAAGLATANAFTGINSFAAATRRPGTAVTGNAINVAAGMNTQSLTGDVTVTFTGSPTTRDWWGYEVTADASARTVTLPANVFPLGSSAALASFVVPASSTLIVFFIYDGTNYRIVNNPALTTGTGSTFALATSPTLVTPVLGTPASGNLSSCTADGTNPVGTKNLPQNAKTGSYTLLATDAGKVVPNTTGGWTVNNSVHAASDVISVYNDSASSQNITAGTITTMRLAGTTTTGTRALAARGFATLYFQSATEVVVSGVGVT